MKLPWQSTTSKSTSANNPQKFTPKDYEQLGRMLANIYETGYIDRGQTYKMSFIKGIMTGLGGVIGATIVVSVILAILSLLDTIPFIGNIVQSAEETIKTK